ncbi:MAG: hypothetical protein H6697_09205 [Myxococcales bacterium]|nr:hypothetical protein [Myxococcales bacterium]
MPTSVASQIGPRRASAWQHRGSRTPKTPQSTEIKRKRTGIEVSEAGAKSPTINAASHDPAQLPQSFFPGAPG